MPLPGVRLHLHQLFDIGLNAFCLSVDPILFRFYLRGSVLRTLEFLLVPLELLFQHLSASLVINYAECRPLSRLANVDPAEVAAVTACEHYVGAGPATVPACEQLKSGGVVGQR